MKPRRSRGPRRGTALLRARREQPPDSDNTVQTGSNLFLLIVTRPPTEAETSNAAFFHLL
jgi:hypothetical protein